eukprot:jgi/Tetstr1/462267/TSEL_007285.t1
MHLAHAATFDPLCMCAGVRALHRQHAPAAASAAHDPALAATSRWCATRDVYRMMPRTPLRGTAVGVCPAARHVFFPLLDRTLAYADRFPPTDDRSYGAEGAVCVFAGLLLRPYPSNSPAVLWKLAERGVRLWEAGDDVRACLSVRMQQLWRESRDGSELHNYQMEAGELPAGTSRSARRRKRRRSARARAAYAEAAERGADAAADGLLPAVVDAHRRAAKLTVVQELRRGRQAVDTADLGMMSDAAAALPVLEALHPPLAPTDPEYSPPEEPPDLRRAPRSWGGNVDEVRRWGEDQRRVMRRAPRLSTGHVDRWCSEHIRDPDVPSWRLWVNRCLAGRCHSRTAAFFALHKDDPAAPEERAKTGEPLRVRPLGVGFRVDVFLRYMMQPSELDLFLEAVDAANISAALSMLGLDACDHSTPRMEAAIVEMNM